MILYLVAIMGWNWKKKVQYLESLYKYYVERRLKLKTELRLRRLTYIFMIKDAKKSLKSERLENLRQRVLIRAKYGRHVYLPDQHLHQTVYNLPKTRNSALPNLTTFWREIIQGQLWNIKIPRKNIWTSRTCLPLRSSQLRIDRVRKLIQG